MKYNPKPKLPLEKTAKGYWKLTEKVAKGSFKGVSKAFKR
jgi:hypothetical protein